MRIISLILVLFFFANGPARAEEVTPEMEQAFLVKYKAAVEKQDIDAYLALHCYDPGVGAKFMAYMKEWAGFAMAFDASSPNRTYTFVPVTPGQQDKPTVFDGKTYVDNLPAVIALKVTFAKPADAAANGYMTDSTKLLGIKDHQLMFVGSKEKK